jgi:hypothetical protein
MVMPEAVDVMVIVCATVFVDASSVKVLAPAIDVVDVVVAPPMVSLLKFKPPPEKVRADVDGLESRILAVSLLRVRPVVVAVLHIVPVPLSVHKPEPIVRVRVLELLDKNEEHVIL